MKRLFIVLCFALPIGCTRGPAPQLAPVAAATISATSPLSASGYVQITASTELFELEAASLALHTSQNPQVTSLAAALIRQHTVTHDRLRAAVERLGLPFPISMRPQEQLRLVQLRLAGANFDAAFREALIVVLSQEIGLHQNYATLGTVDALRREAVAAAALARQHLRAAHLLKPLPPIPPAEEKPVQFQGW